MQSEKSVEQYAKSLIPRPHEHDAPLEDCLACSFVEQILPRLLECKTVREVINNMWEIGKQNPPRLGWFPDRRVIEVQIRHRPRPLDKRAG